MLVGEERAIGAAHFYDEWAVIITDVIVDDVLPDPQRSLATHLAFAREFVVNRWKGVRAMDRAPSAEFPDDVLRTSLVRLPCSWLDDEIQGLSDMLAHALPWLADCPIEELLLLRD